MDKPLQPSIRDGSRPETGGRGGPAPSSSGLRYRYIDILKGLGMLLVMADHSGLPLCPVLDYLEVPVFFFASGFLFSYTPFATFLRKKALRIVVPYVVYALLFILVCLPFGLEVDSIKRLVRMMLAPANYPLWFLKSLLWSLLLLWAFCRIVYGGGHTHGGESLHRTSQRPSAMPAMALVRLLILFAAMAVGVGVCGVSRGHGLLLMTGLPQAVAAMPLLVVGYWLRQLTAGVATWSCSTGHGPVSVAAAALMVAALLLVHGHIGFHACNIGERPLLFYPMAFLSCGAFLTLFVSLDAYAPSTVAQPSETLGAAAHHSFFTFYFLPFTFLMFMGRQSLLYFCVHAIPIYILRHIGMTNPWLLLGATLLITSAMAYVRVRVSEKKHV